MQELAVGTDFFVGELARRPDLPPPIRQKLYAQKKLDVQCSLLESERDSKVQKFFADQPQIVYPEHLAMNPDCIPSIRERFLQMDETRAFKVLRNLALHKN